ncbi:hypothetical protein [Methanobacterium oryzae]|uniref:hypothetical protein n=1 Tax=Methanobacterium oryzae TaxID=69540 RepID=UPI003D1BEA11
MINYLWAWLTTIVVEFVIIWLFIREGPLRLFLYSLLINSFTLPIATYSYINIINNIYFIELMVILVESPLIMLLIKINYKKAFLISFVANFVTALMGFLL